LHITLKTCDGQQREYYSGQVGEFRRIPCFRCGVCCIKRQPELNGREAEAIARGLDMALDLFSKAYIEEDPNNPDTYVFFNREPGCPFLAFQQNLATCTIYEFRPAACRNWMPSLSRPECREGLSWRGGLVEDVATLSQLFSTREDVELFCRSIQDGVGPR
jgi:Fe-S-cluster containining protein